MREILFRGKRKDNGEWVEGCFGQHTSLDAFIIVRPYPTITGDWSALGFYEVVPDTVGQYTGLQDKNGELIFEGDILKVHGGFWEGDTYLTKVWAEGSTLCVYVQGEDYDYTAVNFANDLWDNTGDEPEVIGNIHDNPELLEENHED